MRVVHSDATANVIYCGGVGINYESERSGDSSVYATASRRRRLSAEIPNPNPKMRTKRRRRSCKSQTQTTTGFEEGIERVSGGRRSRIRDRPLLRTLQNALTAPHFASFVIVKMFHIRHPSPPELNFGWG